MEIFIILLIGLFCIKTKEPSWGRHDLDNSGFRDVTPFIDKDVPN